MHAHTHTQPTLYLIKIFRVLSGHMHKLRVLYTKLFKNYYHHFDMNVFDFRKDKKASLHYTGHLLQKYFLTWQLYVLGEKERRQLEESQLATKKRMAALLDAAFSRTLPSSGSPTEKVLDKQALNKKEESPVSLLQT